jgi:hypothetical protein
VTFLAFALSLGFAAAQTSVASYLAAQPQPTGAQTYTYNFTVLGQTYQVKVTTNSSLSDLGWAPDGIGVQFHATTPDGSIGYCDFVVPQNLLGSDLALLVDGSGLVRDVNYIKLPRAKTMCSISPTVVARGQLKPRLLQLFHRLPFRPHPFQPLTQPLVGGFGRLKWKVQFWQRRLLWGLWLLLPRLHLR